MHERSRCYFTANPAPVMGLRRYAKSLKTIFISGYPDLIANAEEIPASFFLQKPFTAVQLAKK
jgi:hypothetical protein